MKNMKTIKLKNEEMDAMLQSLEPLLSQRNKIGYVAARNTRILSNALTEYIDFKHSLIKKYGKADTDKNGRVKGYSIDFNTPEYEAFLQEFGVIKNIEQKVELMTVPYEETIGVLDGREILGLDWMLTE